MNALPESFFPFEKLLARLALAGVDFAVVGGVAVSLNGYIRATRDTDIIVHEAPENLRRLLDCLAGWGEGWARELSVRDFDPAEGSVRIIEDFELDVFTRMRGHALDDFRPRLRYLDIDTVRIPYLAPEDLIELKRESSREKDKIDVAALHEIIASEKREP